MHWSQRTFKLFERVLISLRRRVSNTLSRESFSSHAWTRTICGSLFPWRADLFVHASLSWPRVKNHWNAHRHDMWRTKGDQRLSCTQLLPDEAAVQWYGRGLILKENRLKLEQLWAAAWRRQRVCPPEQLVHMCLKYNPRIKIPRKPFHYQWP